MTRVNHSLKIKPDGWLELTDNLALLESPNHDLRPNDEDPYLLVIHNISLPPDIFTGDAVVNFFLNQLDFDSHPWFENIRNVKVSAHFFIRRNGFIVQLVPTTKRAWHAGVSQFQGRNKCNDFSIGIELEGSDTTAFTEDQYQALQVLTNAICERHPIKHVLGHQHIAPGRKTDPGPFFDWDKISININEK